MRKEDEKSEDESDDEEETSEEETDSEEEDGARLKPVFVRLEIFTYFNRQLLIKYI